VANTVGSLLFLVKMKFKRFFSDENRMTPYRLIVYCCKIVNMRCEENPHHTPTSKITKAYLLGALHDSTKAKYTFRICQKSLEYIQFISKTVKSLGYRCWIYKEGKNRNLYIAEFSQKLLSGCEPQSDDEKRSYVRGYFDSEGGVPRSNDARYYIYFAQKNLGDLQKLKSYVLDLGIKCGTTHNPSKSVDPDYFRFYVLSESWEKFETEIGSFHPVKSKYLRKKI
jgi:hypothetical protein